MDLQEAEKELKISSNNLDMECKRYAGLFWKVSWEHSSAVSERDMAKKRLAEAYAEVAMMIRNDYESFGFEKRPTEAAIKEKVEVSEQVKEAYSDYIKAKKRSDDWDGMKSSHERRGSMLKMAGELWLKNYYSEKTIKSVENNRATTEQVEQRISEKRKGKRPKRKK